MESEQYIDVAIRSMQVAALIAVPLLVLTLVIGLLVSVFMAATQIQDQTIATTIKMFVIAIYWVAGWGFISAATVSVAGEVFQFARYGF
jgi:flagellar biosynthetic protein FliQ